MTLPFQLLDLRGLRCPMPLLKLKQALHQQRQIAQWRVLTSDAGAKKDIPAFLKQNGHELLLMAESETECEFLIRVKPSLAA